MSDPQARPPRPKMEIGNCWLLDRYPDLVHYTLHWTDPAGHERTQVMAERIDTALGKILLERL